MIFHADAAFALMSPPTLYLMLRHFFFFSAFADVAAALMPFRLMPAMFITLYLFAAAFALMRRAYATIRVYFCLIFRHDMPCLSSLIRSFVRRAFFDSHAEMPSFRCAYYARWRAAPLRFAARFHASLRHLRCVYIGAMLPTCLREFFTCTRSTGCAMTRACFILRHDVYILAAECLIALLYVYTHSHQPSLLPRCYAACSSMPSLLRRMARCLPPAHAFSLPLC